MNTFPLVGVFGTGPDEAAGYEQIIREDAERALALDPTLGVAEAAIGVLHYANWRGDEAERAFQRAMAVSPKNTDVLAMYGRFKRFRGEFDESIRLLGLAVELSPKEVNAANQLAQAYRLSGDWEGAAAIYSDLLSQGTTSTSVYAGAATVEALLGNHDEALRLLQLAEQLSQDSFRYAQIAHVHALADNPDGAQRMFSKFETEVRNNPVGDAAWIRPYIAIGDYDSARQRLEAAIETRNPTDMVVLTAVAANPWRDPELDKPEFRELVDQLWIDE